MTSARTTVSILLALTAASVASSARAAPVLFELAGNKTASFILDADTMTPSFFSSGVFGDQLSYNNVTGTFGGSRGVASIGFGTNLFAALNIGGTALGFTQYAGPGVFSVANNAVTFNLGSYTLSSLTSGPATLTLSAATGAVPEPTTWAMLLIGFGAIGFAMRRARSVAAPRVALAIG